MSPTPRQPESRFRPTPWKNKPATPGAFAVIDIDGVLASMAEFEPLLNTERSQDRDWHTFHRSYSRAKVIRAGRKLVEMLQSAGLQIAYSTTRPEQFARATWNWLLSHKFPPGPIMFRHFIKDGSRPQDEVKVRQWWAWQDEHGPAQPIIAWFDDSQTASNMLRAHGCPAWHPKEFLKKVRSVGGTKDAVVEVLKAGPIDMATLDERLSSSRGAWQQSEDAWQAKQKAWFKRHQQALRDRNR
ncbi:hypothetical protein G9U53_30660 [Rhodococcus sp. D-46]|jgi:hypothetical protein|uniref:Uncharacterized protein n=3 Tax=Rhodococcus erythropolis group TaxID=2840174 RepID=A0A1C4GNH6_RHOSG|nr:MULTISPECIES: hypothetical protein [Rhodococcus]NHE68676.1 hypothetical protein [Rhodococcus sp. D-46]AZI65539.1 hypothetical protein EHW12_30945 [Rhodococcus sp. NJ-530]KSU67432.1 hypothetical protein AS032_31530 [Rhodococcus qingshengii]KZF17934.1 hypothetical protein A2J01_22805 [Rhodococcus sp. EPR-134]MDJ0440344.1 hypothetical protein [Rhodococcus qingshengii]